MDKRVFGVISKKEDDTIREDNDGPLKYHIRKEKGDIRYHVNGLGEGAIWISNMNGPLESGDYITTSDLRGYGMRQDESQIFNYTVAKITMDCDFEPKLEPKLKIKKTQIMKSNVVIEIDENVLDSNGELIWEPELDSNGDMIMQPAYKMRYLNSNSDIITLDDYLEAKSNNIPVYRAAFVGCTYHCS